MNRHEQGSAPSTLRLFEAFGVELEYMIVDDKLLHVLPLCDKLIEAALGRIDSDFEAGAITWSNELTLHVVELKTTRPSSDLDNLTGYFQEQVNRINELLMPMNAVLMPTAMHPLMDPHSEMRLWPHDNSPVYAAFDRIFSCKGHGWANLQSTHINLPFCGDDEFGRLHAAIRVILPILPAMAASSPIFDGRLTGLKDSRLDVYRTNARRVPSVSGSVIPEPVYTKHDYQNKLLAAIYRDIKPLDPEGILQHEWLNARGAIARFDRDSIEIRVLDIQECPAADLAMVQLIIETIRALAQEQWCSLLEMQAWETQSLANVLLSCIRDAENALITDREYLRLFGCELMTPCTAGEVWKQIVRQISLPVSIQPHLRTILDEGTLASRIVRALGTNPPTSRVQTVYHELSDCLARGEVFHDKAQP